MKVKVERCSSYFRLTWAHKGEYHRETIPYRDPDDTWWDRSYARAALDLLEHVYGLERRNVRFVEE